MAFSLSFFFYNGIWYTVGRGVTDFQPVYFLYRGLFISSFFLGYCTFCVFVGHWLNRFAEYTLYYREHVGVHVLGVYVNIAKKKQKHRGQLEISNFGTYHRESERPLSQPYFPNTMSLQKPPDSETREMVPSYLDRSPSPPCPR